MSQKLHPIIIGASQFTQFKKTDIHLDPLKLMVKTSKLAFQDIGIDEINKFIDTIYMVNINSWSYADAPQKLSNIVGIKPREKVFLPDGGDSPQMLVNRAAKAISSGKSHMILITGGEAAYSASRARRRKLKLNWPEKTDPNYMEGKLWYGTTDFENKYGMIFPSCSYAMFETAVRAASERDLKEHRSYMGKLFERFSKIAAENPHAWSKKSLTAEKISIPTSENRLINYPYTKFMCSNMFVDQSATIIMTSDKTAKELSIDPDLWVYLMGGTDLRNVFEITRRPRLYDSPAAREGAKIALKQAGLTLDDIDSFDIYSCFPSIVQIIKKEIGLKDDDPRDLTLTGGLPYFGGPWSNYTMHAIVTAVKQIRKDPHKKIMVISNGGYNSKQSFGIYGKNPPAIPWSDRDDSEIQESILENKLEPPIIKANGHITIEAYTFIHSRNGRPKRGIFMGQFNDQTRTCAVIETDPEILEELEQEELVGKTFPVQYDPSSDQNVLILNEN
jgi:acetyl-CoA C-acetyltransferase